MNERIAELAKRAGWIEIGEPDFDNLSAKFNQHFAELIIKECAEVVVKSKYENAKSEYYDGFNEALVYASNKIAEHFGVK